MLGDPATDVTVFFTLLICQMIGQGATIEDKELNNLQPINGIVEDAICFVDNPKAMVQRRFQTLDTRVEDTPEVVLGEDFCKIVGFDFAK